MSINSKHSAGKNDKSAKRSKRKKLEGSEDMESSEEELDLTKECHPIGHYMNDRAEMINQMFSVIKGNKLKAMLPPILKDCDIDLLKLQCLDQLLGMSEKRIACILDGEILETSSESEVESDDYDSDEKNKASSFSTSNGSDESMEAPNEVEKRKVKKKANSVNEEKCGKTVNNDTNPPAAEQGKTLLEILELEMRARAIRALLKQNEITQDGTTVESKISDSKENGIKELSDEVVDLTGCEDDENLVAVKEEKSEETPVEEKVSSTEEKTEKLEAEKNNRNQDQEKVKRMQAELEFRNKLFRKKSYRTRKKKIENEEEENKISEKQEQKEQEVSAVEGPEEGEVSSSEDGISSDVKYSLDGCRSPRSREQKNFGEPPFPPEETVGGNINNFTTDGPVRKEIMRSSKTENAEDSDKKMDDNVSESQDCLNLESEEDVLNIDGKEVVGSPLEGDSPNVSEETSWRERWLRKDGVQKLVKSSKIYAKVKKRIAQKTQRPSHVSGSKLDTNYTTEVEIIEGSIKEYEKLIGKSVQSPQVLKETSQEDSNLTKTSEISGSNESKSNTDGTNNVSPNNS